MNSPIRLISYLALGDSYTIGEAVPGRESFPFQLADIMRSNGYPFDDPVIIAKTGWTTGELQDAIAKASPPPAYDWVSLLIGVNNQYRGLSLDEYANEFTDLVSRAICFAGQQSSRVIVLSIPDWGYTPYAADRDREKIHTEIDAFNEVNKKISLQSGVHYLDITPGTRQSASTAGMLAPDGLHPSGAEYYKWAKRISETMMINN